jgi:hypothetical protein
VLLKSQLSVWQARHRHLVWLLAAHAPRGFILAWGWGAAHNVLLVSHVRPPHKRRVFRASIRAPGPPAVRSALPGPPVRPPHKRRVPRAPILALGRPAARPVPRAGRVVLLKSQLSVWQARHRHLVWLLAAHAPRGFILAPGRGVAHNVLLVSHVRPPHK